MSSKHKQSGPKKKRISSYQEQKLLHSQSKSLTHIADYKKGQILAGKQFYIKGYLDLLKKDIKFYKESKEKYSEGSLVNNIKNQINKDFSLIEEELSESNLPIEKLTELKREYETIKLELNSLGFYDNTLK